MQGVSRLVIFNYYTSYPPGHFVVVGYRLPTGGWYAQRSQGRIEGKVQVCST